MFSPMDALPIENRSALENQALRFMDDFFDRAVGSPPPPIQLKIRNGAGLPDDEDAAMRPPVVLRFPNQTPVLTLRSHELVGRPASVMEGGLALELAVMILQLQPSHFGLNFEREILPMFNVSGSAVQFLRRLVMHLETGLKRLKAVQLVIDTGYSSHLFYYCYHSFQFSIEDRQHYDKLVAHKWMRAIYLAQKNSTWIPLTRLDEKGFASGLKKMWRDCHAYLNPEDQRLLDELSDIPHRRAEEPFAAQIAAMSRLIIVRLLS